MWVVVITSFIAIYLAYLSRIKRYSYLFEIGFILVTFIAAIHYDYGNDYMTYYTRWRDYRYESLHNILTGNTYWGFEIGWGLLNIIFSFEWGFFVMVALLNILQNYIYYYLIKTFVSPSDRWLSMLLYLCTSGLYLLNFSMMRQGLAVSLFVAAIILISKRKLYYSLLILFIAYNIHKTAILGVPFLILYFTPLKNTKVLSIIIASLTAFLFLASSIASGFFRSLMTSITLLDSYESMVGDEVAVESLGLGFVLLHIPHLVILYNLWSGSVFRNTEEKIITVVAFFDILIIPFTYIGSAYMSRLSIYFLAFHLAVIPILYSRIKNKNVRVLLTSIVVFMMLFTYRGFFLTSYWKDTFGGSFHTIFSVI